MKATVVLPTYNEKESVVALLEQLSSELTAPGWSIEAIVVDDASPDGTAQAARDRFPAGKRDRFTVRVIERKGEKGLATAIRRGMEEASGSLIAVMDTDLSHPVATLAEMIHLFEARKVDLVNASRWAKGGGMRASASSWALSRLINFMLRPSLGLPYTDYTGGFFVVRRESWGRFAESDKDFVFQKDGYGEYFIKLMALAHHKELEIAEIPFVYLPRKAGTSKTNALKHGREYLAVIRQIKRWRKSSGPDGAREVA